MIVGAETEEIRRAKSGGKIGSLHSEAIRTGRKSMKLRSMLRRHRARCAIAGPPGCRQRQDRLHHQVSGAVLRHHGERRQRLCGGSSRRGDRLRSGNVGHRYRGADRAHRVHGHQGSTGHRHHAGRSDGGHDAGQGRRQGRQGRPHGQQNSRLEGPDRAGDHEQLEAGKIAGEYLKSVLKNGDTLGILEGVPGVPSLETE